MKKLIILLLSATFLFASCGTTNKKCDGGKKIKTQMW
jgi:hypothetical protein